MATPTSEPVTDAKALLDAANRASEKVAAFHVAFLAVCTYIVVIVFSTSDMDLLIGKGIKLPVLAVDVPIVGFYAMAPYLVILLHFNLLLELQLLSRKLHAFEGAAPQHSGIGDLRDQLNIFPYNYYLVGQPSRLVGLLIAVLVTITILLLPLATLLTLQVRFLAYQSEAVTWAQRVATWLDVGFVAVLWPIIMDRGDSWSAFTKRVSDTVRQRRLRWAWGLAGPILAVTWLASTNAKYKDLMFWALAAWLLLTVSAPGWRHGFCWLIRDRSFTASEVKSLVPGATGLLAVLLLGLPLPLLLLVDGETFDSPSAVGTDMLNKFHLRNLYLEREVSLGKPARPEIIADLRSTNLNTIMAAQRSIEPVNLRGRILRRANLSFVVAPMVGLDGAHLEGANLSRAELPGADFANAQLQGANLEGAQLQGASLRNASLYTNSMPPALELIDLRGLKWRPLRAKEVEALKKIADDNKAWNLQMRYKFLKGPDGATTTAGLKPPTIESCLSDENTEVNCNNQIGLGEFRERVFKELEALACQSSYIAHGILAHLHRGLVGDSNEGLAMRLEDIRK